MNKIKAFTLIELMVVIAIIAIVITLSIPGYSEYGKRQSLFDAKQSLVNYANFLDNSLTNNQELPDTLPEIQGTIIINNRVFITNKGYEILYIKEDFHYRLTAIWNKNKNKNKTVKCRRLELYASGYRNAYNANNQEDFSCWQ